MITVSALLVKPLLMGILKAYPIIKLTELGRVFRVPAQSSWNTRLKVCFTPGSVAVDPVFLAIIMNANCLVQTLSAEQPAKVVLYALLEAMEKVLVPELNVIQVCVLPEL